MANDITRIREALKDAERIRSTFGSLQEDGLHPDFVRHWRPLSETSGS